MFEKSIKEYVNYFLGKLIIEEDRCHPDDRPLYYGKWALSITLCINLSDWHHWDEYKEKLNNLKNVEKIHSNKRLLSFTLFSNKPALLKEIYLLEDTFDIEHIKWIPECNWKKPKKVSKPKKYNYWYRKYPYRVKFKRPFKECLSDDDIEVISDEWSYNHNIPEFVYFKNMGDIICIKMIAYDHIEKIDDRSKGEY